MDTPQPMKVYTDKIREMLSGIGMSSDEIAVILYKLDEQITKAITNYYLNKADQAKLDQIAHTDTSSDDVAQVLGIQDDVLEKLSLDQAKAYIEQIEKQLPQLREKLATSPST